MIVYNVGAKFCAFEVEAMSPSSGSKSLVFFFAFAIVLLTSFSGVSRVANKKCLWFGSFIRECSKMCRNFFSRNETQQSSTNS